MQDLTSVEYFCGVETVVKAFRSILRQCKVWEQIGHMYVVCLTGMDFTLCYWHIEGQKTMLRPCLSFTLDAYTWIQCQLVSYSSNIYINVAMLSFANLRQGVDLTKDEALHNLMLPMGLMWAFRQSLRCVKRGCGMLGIPCNSFTFMSSSQHERTVWQPWGHMVHPWVIEGNCLAARSCLIIMLLIARSVWWLTENPGQSALQFFPVLQHLMAIPEVLAMRIYW